MNPCEFEGFTAMRLAPLELRDPEVARDQQEQAAGHRAQAPAALPVSIAHGHAEHLEAKEEQQQQGQEPASSRNRRLILLSVPGQQAKATSQAAPDDEDLAHFKQKTASGSLKRASSSSRHPFNGSTSSATAPRDGSRAGSRRRGRGKRPQRRHGSRHHARALGP